MSINIGKKLTAQLIQELGRKAAAVPRKRINHNFHESLDNPVQRLIVVMQKGTYIRPHRHTGDNKREFAVAVQGHMQVILLNDDGALRERVNLAPGGRIFQKIVFRLRPAYAKGFGRARQDYGGQVG